MKTAFVKALVCLLVLGAAVNVLAADRSNLILNKTEVIVKHPSGVFVPAVSRDPKLKTIAGDLSTYPYGVFFCCYGYYITGLTNVLGVVPEYWQGVPFTPSANMKVNEVDTSVEYDEGTKEIVLSLNSDSNGLPGKAIHTWKVTNLGTNGGCCQLATGKSKSGIAVKKGQQYWVVVSTNADDASIFASWDVNSTDMRSHPFASYCDDSKQGTCNGVSGQWYATQGILPGFAVLGQ